jgi:hypothetical protein
MQASAAIGAVPAARTAPARAAPLAERSRAEAFRPRLHVAEAAVCRAATDEAGVTAALARGFDACRVLGMDELADLAARELAGGGCASRALGVARCYRSIAASSSSGGSGMSRCVGRCTQAQPRSGKRDRASDDGSAGCSGGTAAAAPSLIAPHISGNGPVPRDEC